MQFDAPEKKVQWDSKLEHLKIVTNGHHDKKTFANEKCYILNNE